MLIQSESMCGSEELNNLTYLHVNTLPSVGDSSMCCNHILMVS